MPCPVYQERVNARWKWLGHGTEEIEDITNADTKQ